MPRRAVTHVDLRARIERRLQRIAEQKPGVRRARPVFQARLVLRGRGVGIHAAPERVEERGTLGRSDRGERREVAVGRDRGDVVVQRAHVLRQPRDRRPEQAVGPLQLAAAVGQARGGGRGVGTAGPGAPRVVGGVGGAFEIAALVAQRRQREPPVARVGSELHELFARRARRVEQRGLEVLEPLAFPECAELGICFGLLGRHPRHAMEGEVGLGIIAG